MTEGLIKIGNITIDIAEVNQIIDYGSHVYVYFDETHDPKYINLVGSDAEAMREWLEADRKRSLADLDKAEGEV
jgi:hypothetical protein